MAENQELTALVCAPADAPVVVPGSVYTHACSRCGRKVMMAPTGQKRLARQPGLPILCYPCYLQREAKSDHEIAMAGTPDEIAAEVESAVPNLRRNRN